MMMIRWLGGDGFFNFPTSHKQHKHGHLINTNTQIATNVSRALNSSKIGSRRRGFS
jgi:hypothetical protein